MGSVRRHLRSREADHAFVARGEPPDLEVVRTDGDYVVDARGRRHLDLTMGWCVGNFGWANDEITARLRDFDGPTYVAPGHAYRGWTEVGALLAKLTPGRLRTSFRATGGTEAVEIAMQIARAYTGRDRFLAIEGAYHGNSIATIALVEDHTIPPPLDERALAKAERILARKQTAAVILEPIVCNLGVAIPEPAFMAGLAEACRRTGTLLVADEVACGFGRTGALFACEHYGLAPDVLCVAKALTGGHAAMGATITTPAIARAVADEVHPWSTYGWHPLSCEAAIATLRWLDRHRGPLLRNVGERSEQFRARLSAMDLGDDVELRIKGLAIGLELGDEDRAEAIRDACAEAGLIVSGEEGLIEMFPALTIDAATVDLAMRRFEACL